MASRSTVSDWLALVLAPGLGTRRFAELSEYFDSPSGWIEASDRDLLNAGLNRNQIRALHHPDPETMQRCLDWLAPEDHHLITLEDDYYPPLLRDIADPPPALFVAGQPDCLLSPQLAIVGSRNATAGGLDHARSFAATLASAGLVITSGLAAGVDGNAHAACLDAGGRTVAVAGTGLDRVYPARHRDLAQRIVRQGALVSTFPPGTEPRAGHFPARNRLISGMSLGTLVVEAGQRSGSLITARLASEQGREVFAIPGSVHNPLARGCHRLIREGAKLIETAEEVLEELRPLAGQLGLALAARLATNPDEGLDSERAAPHVKLDEEQRRLLDAIGYDPTPVDEIIRRTQLTTAAVSSMLLLLELDGHVTAHAGGRYSRTHQGP
ncbi:DNA-processing protein DprA [Wenzhouxiangella limi]|uniref:DNA-protecting protein DprA n=1 Tax=Wenzhouxiangella limi TaxID=2707351 RepID=A0A845V0Z9_9GAMM|nr:DNA-processing protein DprA [Wenzhouxiangella limi]NDY95890.1 DNA-protecting protein DprA [Wenzhouxiangella limi]